MKEPNKYNLLVIAPSGIHLKNFLDRIEDACSEILIISSEPLIFETEHPIEFVDFSLRKLQNHWQTPNRIATLCAGFKPDMIHVHQINSVAYFAVKALRKFNIPIVATAWGSDILVIPDQGFLQKALVRYTLKRADAFTSDSTFMAQRMRELIPERKLDIAICNFGVADPIFDLPKENIIYANRLHKPLYRVDKIVSAFALFSASEEGKQWRLVIGAVGTETDELKRQVAELGISDKVEFVGWLEREDNMKWYAKAKVWASVPASDATAISLLEAMCYGCYPVVSDLPASHEWVENNVTGRIVNDVDSDFFSQIDHVDFKAAAEANKKRIELDGTFKVNEAKFRAQHLRLINHIESD